MTSRRTSREEITASTLADLLSHSEVVGIGWKNMVAVAAEDRQQ